MARWKIPCLALVVLRAQAEPVTFTHMADASAGEWLGDGLFVAASDEDNELRVYRFQQGGAPVAAWDLTPHLATFFAGPFRTSLFFGYPVSF